MSFSLNYRKGGNAKETNDNTPELEVSSSSSSSRSLLSSSLASSNDNDVEINIKDNRKSNSVISENSLMEHRDDRPFNKSGCSSNNSKSNVDSIDEQERKEEMVLMEMVRQTATLPWNGDEYETHCINNYVDELSINSENKNSDLTQMTDTNNINNCYYELEEPFTEGSNDVYDTEAWIKEENYADHDHNNDNDCYEDDDVCESESITSPYQYFDHEFHYFVHTQQNRADHHHDHKSGNQVCESEWEDEEELLLEHKKQQKEYNLENGVGFFAETHPCHRRKLTPQYKVMNMADPEFVPLTPYEYSILEEEDNFEYKNNDEDDNKKKPHKLIKNGSKKTKKKKNNIEANSKATSLSSENEINRLNGKSRYNSDNCIRKHKHKFVDKSSCSWISTRTTTTVLLPSASIRMLYNVDNMNINYYPNNYNNSVSNNNMHNNFFRVNSFYSESRNSNNNNQNDNQINNSINTSVSGNNLSKCPSEPSKMPNTLREKVKAASLPPLCS